MTYTKFYNNKTNIMKQHYAFFLALFCCSSLYTHSASTKDTLINEINFREKLQEKIVKLRNTSGIAFGASIVATFIYNAYATYLIKKKNTILTKDNINNVQGILFSGLKLCIMSSYITLPHFLSSLCYEWYNSQQIDKLKKSQRRYSEQY